MLKNILLILLSVFILLAILGLMAGGFFVYQNTRPLSVINVNSTVKQSIKPNQANSIAYLEIREADLTDKASGVKGLNKLADDKTVVVLKYLNDQKIETKNIKTNKYTTKDYEFFTPVPDKQQDPADMVVVEFTIDFKNLEVGSTKPNEILDGLISAGIKRFNPLTYSIADQEVVCEKLEAQALSKVTEKAKTQVKDLGGTLTRIEPTITQGCSNYGGYPGYPTYKSDIAMSSGPAMPAVQTGEMELTVVAAARAEYR